MKILLVATAFNSLTQRVFTALRDRGHSVGVELAVGDGQLRERVRRDPPDLIVAPMLTTAVPQDVWSSVTCLVVHPGPLGDRGPSSLDWAVGEGARRWGVTVLQAEAEMDAGPVWASVPCPLAARGKSDLYRNEIADAALEAVLLAVARFASGTHRPRSQAEPEVRAVVHTRPPMRQHDRRIRWDADRTEEVLRTLRAADSQPGVLDELFGEQWFLHGGHRADGFGGNPGDVVAARAGAICRATADGAVWIPQLRPRRTPGGPRTFTLPAVTALGDRLAGVPEMPAPLHQVHGRREWNDIRYREVGATGFLSFSFPGGAMSTGHCRRLLSAYRQACERPTTVLVLGGERDFFSNGIHLNVIEAAPDPAEESWANINAIDDLVEAVLTTTDRVVVAALGGNAAAGGVMLALAADEVWCRSGAVLNPHYRLMGLYGSEFWTYSLPRRVGDSVATALTEQSLPVSAERAERLGLVDRVLPSPAEGFALQAVDLATRWAATAGVQARIAAKKGELDRREQDKPLNAYRAAELERMHAIFFDPGHPYHALRRAFVRKERPTVTPEHLRALSAVRC
ncbi:hydrogenase maturation protein [Actinacidiphila rubida]|uniref:Putative two-component system protein, hydrogenase maturation factor HypX/HoxX n=1 Tax=Actinacidiphila rubida TaxID=310780 RepID=A0A1H8STG2_9ACTN|nr:hydrogenase maturation protein [Actinacidiphila rubida]SEO81463.1 putative two-component system protein, hydrogenase maturation factor HypX/HoxX [Actinacidiphila rubida]